LVTRRTEQADRSLRATIKEDRADEVNHTAMVVGRREVAIMKTILLAGVAAVVLGIGAAWVARPTLPGDQFQLADGKDTQTRVAESNDMRTAPGIGQMLERDL
jgi:hypothetical protein